MNNIESNELFNKIREGLKLSYQRLLAEKQRDDKEMAIYKDGRVQIVKARDLKAE